MDFEVLKAWFDRRPGEDVLETELWKAFFPTQIGERIGLDLFRTHFLLYRRLWMFDDELRTTTGHRLWIRGIRITYLAPPPEGQCRWLNSETGLFCGRPGSNPCGQHSTNAPDLNTTKAYYLDPANLEGMTEQGVRTLMDGFFAGLERSEALQALGLPPEADDHAVKARWRKLSMDHHPDRGGDPEQFRLLSAAMATLRHHP